MAGFGAFGFGAAAVDFTDSLLATNTPAWVRNDNISLYELDIPNRVVRQNYPPSENGLASPQPKRMILGVVGGNEVSRMAGNPQDIESDLSWRTRPLTKCPGREYKPMKQGQDKIVYDNRKTQLAIDVRTVDLPEMQMWGYPATLAPLPLKKETCGQPQKY